MLFSFLRFGIWHPTVAFSTLNSARVPYELQNKASNHQKSSEIWNTICDLKNSTYSYQEMMFQSIQVCTTARGYFPNPPRIY